MSKAALALLTADADETAAPAESPSKRAIALLEGRVKVAESAPHAYRYDPGTLDTDPDVGAAEAGLHAITSLAGSAVGGVHAIGDLLVGRGADAAGQDIDWWKQALTYQPRTTAGQGATDVGAGAMAYATKPIQAVKTFAGESAEEAGWGPLASTAMEMAPDALLSLAGAPGMPKGAGASFVGDAQAAGRAAADAGRTVIDATAPARKAVARAFERTDLRASPADPLGGFGADTASAAAASRITAAKNISPELVADLRAQVQRGPLNPEAVDRLIDADALPVRMRLMEGQASRDPEVWSREFNAKGKDPDTAARFNEQNQQLIDNLDEFRRQAAPQAVAHDPVQSGQNILDAYKSIDEAANTEINAAYKAARDANGGDLPMDGQGFVAAADAALKQQMKARYLPAEVAADLNDFRSGERAMTFADFENMRTNLAAAGRKAERAGDGNAAAAINLTRDALEGMEPIGQAAEVKPLFDKARALARVRFDKIKADPAYKAAVNDDVAVGEASPLADKFVQKYIVGAPRAHVERMLGTLAGEDLAMETVHAAPFNYLKQKAGIDPYRNEGNFSQHGYNRALAELMPKLDLLAGEELAEQAQRLGRVAYDVKGEPAGSFPNRSNTLIAATAEAAKGLAERGANTLIGQNIVPVGSWAREKLSARTAKRESRERMRPAAGALAKEKKP